LVATSTFGLAMAAQADDALPLPASMEGFYEGKGVTTVKSTGSRRRVKGTFVVTRAANGDGYEIRFSFKTQMPSPGGPMRADLLGTGDARVVDDKVLGTTETQLLFASIPGVDPQFAFIPGKLGPRIQQTFQMTATDEPGEFKSEIESEAVPGYEYPATRTTMRVKLIDPTVPQDKRLPLPQPHDD
jgi:hypothetical protein